MKLKCLLVVTASLLAPSPSLADESVETLISQLAEGKSDVRDKIVSHGEDAIEPLSKVLRDKKADYLTRATAALLLGRIGGKSVIGPLKSALDDNNVQVFAVIALEDVGRDAKDALPDLVQLLKEEANDKDSLEHGKLIDAVGSIGYGSKEAADALTLCMKEERDHHAALTLTKIGKPGVEALVSLAVKYSTDPRAHQDRRYGEAYGVLRSGTPLPKEAIPVLKKHLLKGGNNAIVAELGFGCIGKPAIPVLKELLDDNSPDVRASAAKSLARMNFLAHAARTFRGEKVANPVSSDEFFPKLKKIYRLPNGEADRQILRAMVNIDEDRFMADQELVKAMLEK